MFQVNELVLFGTTGVCRVEAVEPHEMPGTPKGRLYYRLAPLYKSGVIYVPADSESAPLRPIITREQAERLIELLPSVDAGAFDARTPQELAAQYQQVIRQHECESLAALIVTLYTKRQSGRKFGKIDETFLRRACELLHGELATALGLPPDEIEPYIAARIAEHAAI